MMPTNAMELLGRSRPAQVERLETSPDELCVVLDGTTGPVGHARFYEWLLRVADACPVRRLRLEFDGPGALEPAFVRSLVEVDGRLASRGRRLVLSRAPHRLRGMMSVVELDAPDAGPGAGV